MWRHLWFSVSRKVLLVVFREGSPDTAFECAPFHKHIALAFEAPDADVSTYSDHLPLVVAAGVFLLETDDVTQSDFHFKLWDIKSQNQCDFS